MGKRLAIQSGCADGGRWGQIRCAADTGSESPAGGQEGRATGETGGGIEEIQVVSGLADGLKAPAPGACNCKAPGQRGAHAKTCPANKKYAGGDAPASSSSGVQARTKPAGKGADLQQTKVMVQTLLTVAFNITSMRAGDHWKLQPAEAEALAEPIAAIMDRHNLTEKTGAYGDYIALAAAFGMVIVPKIMLSMEQSKRKGGLKVVRSPEQVNGKIGAGAEAGSVPDAKADAGSHRPVQPSNPLYAPSDVKQSLAYLG